MARYSTKLSTALSGDAAFECTANVANVRHWDADVETWSGGNQAVAVRDLKVRDRLRVVDRIEDLTAAAVACSRRELK